MAKQSAEKIMLSEHSMEVRHAASGSFLDVRGYVADYIRESSLFPHWKIDLNVVNFRDEVDKIKREGAFAGYKNAGYIVLNPETRNYFPDKASLFWKTLLKNDYYKVPEISRFGARTKVFLPSDMSFKEVNSIIFNSIYTEKAREMIKGTETDVQFIIELTEDVFEVRVSGGPIHIDEASNHMSFESDHFKKCGLFLDIDYYKSKEVSHENVPKLLKNAIDLTWLKVEKIASTIGI